MWPFHRHEYVPTIDIRVLSSNVVVQDAKQFELQRIRQDDGTTERRIVETAPLRQHVDHQTCVRLEQCRCGSQRPVGPVFPRRQLVKESANG